MIILQLLLSFMQIGVLSIGGGLASIALIQNQVVDLHAWLTMGEFADVIAIAEMTPGPIGLNCATFVGLRIAGVPGALAASVGFLLLPAVIVMLLAFIYYRFKGLSVMEGVLAGLRPAVVAMIASAALSIISLSFFGTRSISAGLTGGCIHYVSIAIFAVAIYLLRVRKVSPIRVMMLAAACGIV